MKVTKLIAALSLVCGFANAATITLSSGLTAQGILVTTQGVANTTFNVSIGSWNATTSTFSVFGSTFADNGKISGAQTSDNVAFNGARVDVFLSNGPGVSTAGTEWVVFTRTTPLAFPANVVPAGNTTYTVSSSAVVTFLAKGDIGNGFTNANTLNLVPEPSAALLGALGALGLLRRRRI